VKTHNIHIDSSIIDRLQRGEEDALTELYRKYWRSLYITSYNVLKNKQLCEDIVQEIFISIWNRRENLSIKTSLKSYLYACVRYQVFAQIKKNRKMLRVDLFNAIDQRIEYTSPETEFVYKELVQQMNKAIESLPKKCKRVYLLSRNENLSNLEIANELHISKKTVENHMTKALRILKMATEIALYLMLYSGLHFFTFL